MIKRVAVLFLVTGAGYGFSVLALKYLAKNGDLAQVAAIGELESLMQFLIGLIGFGMQTEAIRSISFSEDWRAQLGKAQQARITFSLLLIFVSLFSFYNQYYLYFLLAPIVAFSSDYALYARGFPLIGSSISFVRVVVPLVSSLLAVFMAPRYLLLTYVVSSAVSYALTNAFISWYLKTPLFYIPRFSSLKLYLSTVPLGIINLCFYFFGLGLLMLVQFFFEEKELVVCFVALKFYLIYKGAIRVIQQAFVNRMTEDAICLSVDHISIMMSVLFLGSILIFPSIFISLFFGEQFNSDYWFFVFLGFSAVAFSIFNSANTRALLERQDKLFMKIALSAVLITVIAFLFLFQFNKRVEVVTLSLLIGESFFTCLLAIRFFNWNQIMARISILLLCSIGLVLPWLVKYWLLENMLVYISSFGILSMVMLLFSYKKLRMPEPSVDLNK